MVLVSLQDKIKNCLISNNKHIFLIGGSPSTGSSLLRQLVNRHPSIYCAPETQLFCKEELYANWKKNKHRIHLPSLFGLKSIGRHPFIGFDFSELTQKIDLHAIVDNADSYSQFVFSMFNTLNSTADTKAIGEKTPANVLLFSQFLKTFKSGKTIHIVRNPYDVVASLLARGIGLLESCLRYLLHTYSGLALRNNQSNLEIRYEDLIVDSEKTLQIICAFLSLPFSQKMLDVTKTKSTSVTKLPGWNHDETEAIGDKSINRYKELDASLLSKIHYYLSHIRIKGIDLDFDVLCNHYNYNQWIVSKDYSSELAKDLSRDKLSQAFKNSNYSYFNYPFYAE